MRGATRNLQQVSISEGRVRSCTHCIILPVLFLLVGSGVGCSQPRPTSGEERGTPCKEFRGSPQRKGGEMRIFVPLEEIFIIFVSRFRYGNRNVVEETCTCVEEVVGGLSCSRSRHQEKDVCGTLRIIREHSPFSTPPGNQESRTPF